MASAPRLAVSLLIRLVPISQRPRVGRLVACLALSPTTTTRGSAATRTTAADAREVVATSLTSTPTARQLVITLPLAACPEPNPTLDSAAMRPTAADAHGRAATSLTNTRMVPHLLPPTCPSAAKPTLHRTHSNPAAPATAASGSQPSSRERNPHSNLA